MGLEWGVIIETVWKPRGSLLQVLAARLDLVTGYGKQKRSTSMWKNKDLVKKIQARPWDI